jgi:hypothetical protein
MTLKASIHAGFRGFSGTTNQQAKVKKAQTKLAKAQEKMRDASKSVV